MFFMKDLYDHEVDVGFTKMWENQTFLHRNSSDSLTASVMLDNLAMKLSLTII